MTPRPAPPPPNPRAAKGRELSEQTTLQLCGLRSEYLRHIQFLFSFFFPFVLTKIVFFLTLQTGNDQNLSSFFCPEREKQVFLLPCQKGQQHSPPPRPSTVANSKISDTRGIIPVQDFGAFDATSQLARRRLVLSSCERDRRVRKKNTKKKNTDWLTDCRLIKK